MFEVRAHSALVSRLQDDLMTGSSTVLSLLLLFGISERLFYLSEIDIFYYWLAPGKYR